MKKSLLFIGIVITSLVMLFTCGEAKSFYSQYPVLKKEVSGSVMEVSFKSEPRLPLNNSGDKNTTRFQAAPSFSSQVATYFIRLNQQVLCSFKTLFERQYLRSTG